MFLSRDYPSINFPLGICCSIKFPWDNYQPKDLWWIDRLKIVMKCSDEIHYRKLTLVLIKVFEINAT